MVTGDSSYSKKLVKVTDGSKDVVEDTKSISMKSKNRFSNVASDLRQGFQEMVARGKKKFGTSTSQRHFSVEDTRSVKGFKFTEEDKDDNFFKTITGNKNERSKSIMN